MIDVIQAGIAATQARADSQDNPRRVAPPPLSWEFVLCDLKEKNRNFTQELFEEYLLIADEAKEVALKMANAIYLILAPAREDRPDMNPRHVVTIRKLAHTPSDGHNWYQSLRTLGFKFSDDTLSEDMTREEVIGQMLADVHLYHYWVIPYLAHQRLSKRVHRLLSPSIGKLLNGDFVNEQADSGEGGLSEGSASGVIGTAEGCDGLDVLSEEQIAALSVL